MADSKTSCTGNCMACAPFQRQYCAAQMTYSNMNLINTLIESVNRLNDKIDKMQSEAEVFNPMKPKPEPDEEDDE